MTTPMLAVAALAALATPQEPIPAPLAGAVPALNERSVWRLTATPDAPASEFAAFPVGDGRVFGAVTADGRACALTGLVGPDLGVPAGRGGVFGTLSLELIDADGAPLPLPRRTVERTPDAGFVVAEDASDRAALRATFFAPPGEARILAAVDVAAVGTTRLEGIRLVARLDPGAATDGGVLRAEHRTAAGTVRARVGLRADGAEPARGRDGALAIELPPLEPGQHVVAALEFVTARAAKPPGTPVPDRAAVEAAARDTAAFWEQRLAGTTRYDTDHLRIRDLLRDARITLLAQTCASTGMVVPMLGDRRVTVRGQNGPLLLLLRHRFWDDARRILEGWWNIARTTGRVPVELALEDVPTQAPEDRGDAAFWNRLDVPAGDVGSWVVLQHFWYWRATRDTALLVRHWPLIEACFKRQPRRDDILIPFAGDEPWLVDVADLPADVLGADPELIGYAPHQGRPADSFAASVTFLMALHAVGDMVDGIDRVERPERWADGPPKPAPSAAYVRRAFELMTALEARYWQPDLGCFAPARSPVDGSLHRVPVANANLLPLWVGWTFPTGERSRDNLQQTLGRLHLDGARIGTTRTLGAATGDAQGLLLTALAERDGRARRDAMDALVAMAEPAGSWATFHGADGRPIAGAPMDPAVLGVDVDALLFAITGIRQAAYANWDDDDIRLELRLPAGATWFNARGATKDGRTLDVFFREEIAPLSEEERRSNDELAPDRRRDPNVPHRRVHFVVELVEGDPPRGYYDVAINAEGTVYVRYLQPDPPASPEQADLRRITETEFAAADQLAFLPERRGAGPAPAPAERAVDAGAARLALTWRPTAAEMLAGPGVTLFDPAMPFEPDQLERLLLADGEPRHAALYLDWRYDAAAPASWNGAYFASPAWAELLARFRAAGGAVLEPGFVRRFDVDGAPARARDDGALELPAGGSTVRVQTALSAATAGEAVLRCGSDAPLRLRFRGREFEVPSGSAVVEPDRVAWLIELGDGEDPLEIEVGPRADGGPRVLWVRLSDPNGLPRR